jgi:peptidoglycan/LPS O-acetylase OafA/YrhL
MDASASKRAAELDPTAPVDAHSAVAGRPGAATSAEVAERPTDTHAGESSHELRALHGLRFLAAFCILFSHACDWLANFKDDNAIHWCGEVFTVYGMPLFFVLSGFVIHYNYSRLFSTMRPRWAIAEFLGARFARIYPLFICFFLVGIAVDGVMQWYDHHQFNLLLVLGHYLTLTQAWVYIIIFSDRFIADGPFGLSWSLSTEFFFYLAYIALVLHIARLRRISSLLITAGVMSIFVVAAVIYAQDHLDQIAAFAARYMNDHFEEGSDYSFIRWLFYYSPYVRVFEFILGCLTAQIYARLAANKVSPDEARLGRYLTAVSVAALAAVGLIYVFEPFGSLFATYFNFLKLNYGCAVPIALLIFCVSRYRSSAVATILSAPLMVLLGDLSYSIYTVHIWTLRIFVRPETASSNTLEAEAVLRIVLAIALTVILSTATYRLIEVPARAWLRRSVARRLVRSFGPRESNTLPAGQFYSGGTAIMLAMLFAAMLGAVLAYQFLVVPHFSRFTE